MLASRWAELLVETFGGRSNGVPFHAVYMKALDRWPESFRKYMTDREARGNRFSGTRNRA